MQKTQTTSSPVALMTGAARRIGAEIAHALHAAGINLVLHYHVSQVEAEQLCAELNKVRPHSAVIAQADLLNIANLDALASEAHAAWGRLDVLVNNASRFYRTPLGSVNEAEWDDLLTSNLKAPFFLSQAVAPFLAKQKGCIVNLADIHGERPMSDYAVYCISKAGLLMLTKALAKELGPLIRVNAVSPGPVMWPEGDNALSDADEQKLIDYTVLKRAGNAAEVAKAVLFFIRSADYVTGQVISVDGGRSLRL